MWIYNDFSTSINITQIRLYTMYFDSTGGAAAILSSHAAAVYETMHVPCYDDVAMFVTMATLPEVGYNCRYEIVMIVLLTCQ